MYCLLLVLSLLLCCFCRYAFSWIAFRRQGARIIKSSHFELDYMLGRKITFFCMAKGFPRPEITWFKDGIELYYHKFFQVGLTPQCPLRTQMDMTS